MQFDLNQSIDVLERTPAVLSALLNGIDDRWARANEGPDTFSPFDVVCHLIGGDESDWIRRAEIIRAQGPNPAFTPFDRYGHLETHATRSLPSLLTEFAALRARNLAELRSWQLTSADLALTGIHPTFGRVTLEQLLSTWTVHDLGHIAQISRVMAKQYRDAIGPWVAFLPVVTDRPTPAT